MVSAECLRLNLLIKVCIILYLRVLLVVNCCLVSSLWKKIFRKDTFAILLLFVIIIIGFYYLSIISEVTFRLLLR